VAERHSSSGRRLSDAKSIGASPTLLKDFADIGGLDESWSSSLRWVKPDHIPIAVKAEM
jgi:hypothetical protein